LPRSFGPSWELRTLANVAASEKFEKTVVNAQLLKDAE
jgi:hypothetical protein